jgi:methyl-accepting chemotaxis protein
VAGILGWSKAAAGTEAPRSLAVAPSQAGLHEVLTTFLSAQVRVLDESTREQGLKLQQAEVLMAEAVRGFGGALQALDAKVQDQYRLAMELQRVLEVSIEGEEGVQSVEAFTNRILGTLDLFVLAMLEIGQSSFQLVEEMDGIRERSGVMVASLGELAEVASRTQMLALNASIEAAHARQYGAGFSVVAGEVQKLADRSGRISDKISEKVHETEAALNRTAVQVEIIASKDLNEIIRSKQLAETMVKAISQSELQAQQLVARMEAIGREVTEQVGRSIQALQFEDMVRQILQRVAADSGRLVAFSARLRSLAEAVAEGREPLVDLLAQAARDLTEFNPEGHDSVQASSMNSGDVELF